MTEPKPTQPLEGEGSYSATRRYNQHLGEAIAETDLEAGAEAARRAVEGPEGEELRRAAEQAKHGPKGAAKKPQAAADQRGPGADVADEDEQGGEAKDES